MTFKNKVSIAYQRLTPEEKRLLAFIPDGKENSMAAKDLEQFTGLSQRELSDFSRRLLNKGFPLIACSHGFFKANSYREVAEYKRREQARDLQHAKTVEACDKFLNG